VSDIQAMHEDHVERPNGGQHRPTGISEMSCCSQVSWPACSASNSWEWDRPTDEHYNTVAEKIISHKQVNAMLDSIRITLCVSGRVQQYHNNMYSLAYTSHVGHTHTHTKTYWAILHYMYRGIPCAILSIVWYTGTACPGLITCCEWSTAVLHKLTVYIFV
jgi:hypothetical protein